MSAGAHAATVTPESLVQRDLAGLAPKFRDAVVQALADCAADGLDAYVYESVRSDELQAMYYARGRTVVPPLRPVTNARTAQYGWHKFGLAVDVISRVNGWDVPETWFRRVATHFKAHGCKSGIDWVQHDAPHHQWGACKPSPSDRARAIYASEGLAGVWRAVGAD